MKVTLTSDLRQLLFDFDAPIAAVVSLRPSGPTFGMPVSLDWDDPASITVSTPETGVLGHVWATSCSL